MSRKRGAFVATVIVAAVALVLGFSSTSAPGSVSAKPRVVVVGRSPSRPVAGEPFTLRWQLQLRHVPMHIADAGCQAQIGRKGHRLPVVDRGNDGIEAFCTWNVPADASGKTFDGLISATADSGVRYILGFDVPVS
jgi:hypothetical protein